MTGGVNSNNEYTFGSFTYRASDNTFSRDGKTLQLTPKALELLRIFLANPGRLLGKDELMNELWPDTFVEESNLAVTVRRLRKALADDAQNPIYVETVARQGYRFIAAVNLKAPRHLSQISDRRERSLRYLVPLAVVGALLIASISLGSRYLNRGSHAAPILAAPFASQKLSTGGNVNSAAISPDGEKVVYAVRGATGESVWLRETASASNIEIIPALNEAYYNFAFAPDGSTLYFTRGPRKPGDPADIFRVSVFGGVPTKIATDTRGWISVSPDGNSISFVRCRVGDDGECSLWTADSKDGKHQMMLTSRRAPFRISANEIAPDGKTIVFAVGQSENAGNDFEIAALDLKTGEERVLSNERFFDIKSLEILPDNSGAFITASRGSTQQFQIWKIDFAAGHAEQVTKDSASFGSISLDSHGSRMVATQVSNNFRLMRSNLKEIDRTETLAEPSRNFAFDSKGGVIFQSESSGDFEIWRMDADGSSRRQLTNSVGDDVAPIASAAGDDLFFCSNRSGKMQVWRMKADGSDQRQLTSRAGGMPVFADAEWVYYQHGIDRNLWRVSLETGAEDPVYEKAPHAGPFVFSRSGTRAAYIELRGAKQAMVIISIPEGRELMSSEFAEEKGRIELAWLADESAVAYSSSDPELASNTLWFQPLTGGDPYRSADIAGDPVIFLSFPPETDSVAFVQGRWRHDIVMLFGLH